MKTLISPLLFCFFFLLSMVAYAQNDTKEEIQRVFNQINQYADSTALEKIYLHTDKPFYAVGDTLWFKSYVFQSANLGASEKSGLMYIEVSDEQNRVVKRLMVPLYVGLGWGNIPLSGDDFPQGNYILRAYTNWMRNFDEHYISKVPFYIISPGEKDLLINAKLDLTQDGLKQKAAIGLILKKLDKTASALADFRLQINEGNKVWYKDEVRTSIDGTVDFNFEVPEKANPGKLSITLQSTKKTEVGQIYKIPIILNRPENIDLQFMPESGALVAGLGNRVAFKALGEDGTGTSVSGKVYDSRQKEVLSFHSTHLGMGSFSLLSAPGESYTAKITLPNNTSSKAYPLPAVKSSGLTMNIVNKLESDSLEINIDGTDDLKTSNALYYLLGQSRGISCYAAALKLSAGQKKVMVSKQLFPTGVARFTILNRMKQVLHERIVFIDQNDYLQVEINTNKKDYAKRDSVGLDIMVKDKFGKPVTGAFSIAITDDAQVKIDSLKRSSLKSVLFLTSSLKGHIEDPGYYFPNVLTPQIWQDLDNLLLAQGWVNYDWTSVFQPLKPALFKAEDGFSITGKVTNMLNGPVKGSGVVLFSRKPVFFLDTVTNNLGRFTFKDISPSDTTTYFIQAKNRNGKSFNVGVEVDEFKEPVFAPSTRRIVPWYLNVDSGKTAVFNNYVAYQKESETLSGSNVLKEVQIVGIKRVRGSKNLNKDGGSDFSLSQERIDASKGMTLGTMLRSYVKGFVLGKPLRPYHYFVYYMDVHFIIDGIDLDTFWPSKTEDLDYVNYIHTNLDFYTAKDIKGIEVMSSLKYSGSYSQKFLDPMATNNFEHLFIEITTHSGAGPFVKKIPGTYVFKPLKFSSDKQFYSPKYGPKPDFALADVRSTIFWSPNVISDENGKAKVSFYTADKAGTYTLYLDGSDMNGHVESTSMKINVK